MAVCKVSQLKSGLKMNLGHGWGVADRNVHILLVVQHGMLGLVRMHPRCHMCTSHVVRSTSSSYAYIRCGLAIRRRGIWNNGFSCNSFVPAGAPYVWEKGEVYHTASAVADSNRNH